MLHNNNMVTIKDFIRQIEENMQDPNDEVCSIGTVCSFDSDIKYTIHCKDNNQKDYEINIHKTKNNEK